MAFSLLTKLRSLLRSPPQGAAANAPLLTYLDTGVLIAAWKGSEDLHLHAIRVIDDEHRKFVVSDVLRLELLAHATFAGRTAEVEFMQAFLEAAEENVPLSEVGYSQAIGVASKYGLGPVDALHAVAATRRGVREFVTTEKPTKPLHSIREFRVTHLSTF